MIIGNSVKHNAYIMYHDKSSYSNFLKSLTWKLTSGTLNVTIEMIS